MKWLSTLVTLCLGAFNLGFGVTAHAAVALPTKSQTLTLIINISETGAVTREALVGVPTTVDQHMQLGWASTKLDANGLAGLPSLSLANVNSNAELGALEDSLFAARRTAYENGFMRPMAAWLRTNNVNTGFVEVRQKITHKGVVKVARNLAFVWPSGYWHMNKVRVRSLDGSLKILYASYRPQRNILSDAEADEVPLSKDANTESGRVGLWVSVKDPTTWADLTTPVASHINNKFGTPLLDLANVSYPKWDVADPSLLVVDPNWPGRCILDRTYVDKSGGPARPCPNTTDIKGKLSAYDVDFVVLDAFEVVEWRLIPTSTPGTFTKDFRVTVNSRTSDCGAFPSEYNLTQSAVLTGTAMLRAMRYVMYPDGQVDRVQVFEQPYQVNYPYTAGITVRRGDTPRWQAYSPCGSPYWQVNDGLAAWMQDSCPSAPISLVYPGFTFFDNAVIKPKFAWRVDNDRGRFTGYVPPLHREQTVVLQNKGEAPNSHYTVAPNVFTGANCGSPIFVSCPPGYHDVGGTCVLDACPPGQERNASGVCDTCPAPGMIRDAGGNCACPVCQMLVSGASGPACVSDPSQTTGACSGIQTCESKLNSDGIACNKWRIQPGTSPLVSCQGTAQAGAFVAGASVALNNCACTGPNEVWQWLGVSGTCAVAERDVCADIPGVQTSAPPGRYMDGKGNCPLLGNLGTICTCQGAVTVSNAGSLRTVTATCNDPGVGPIRSVVVFDMATRSFVSSTATNLAGPKIAECPALSVDTWDAVLQ